MSSVSAEHITPLLRYVSKSLIFHLQNKIFHLDLRFFFRYSLASNIDFGSGITTVRLFLVEMLLRTCKIVTICDLQSKYDERPGDISVLLRSDCPSSRQQQLCYSGDLRG